jgi:L,D-peptidoglycan transpeptidase YkuD (ErfK/YbiS/YcfS/YnhG family)
MKQKSKYLLGIIIIFILAGSGFAYVSHVQKVKAAEEQRIIESAQEMVGNLYNNDKKEALADDISDKKISKAQNKTKQVKDISVQQSLVKEINNIAFLYKTKTEMDGLLIEGVLIEEADETKISAISKSVDKTKIINKKIYTTYKSNLEEINSQFNAVKTAKEKLLGLFSDPDASTVKNDITRDMYHDAKNSIDAIKNAKVKEGFSGLLAKADSELTVKEEKEKQEKLRQQQLENAAKTQNQQKLNSTPTSTQSTAQVQNPTDLASIVARSGTANKTNQIVTVVASGSTAKISLLEKSGGTWAEVIKTNGYVGSLGVGQAREGSSRTPKGSYSLGFAFGTSNPGTKLPFRQITPNSYWISNVNDPDYNTWQERESSAPADEHLADYTVQYQYAIVINYNNGVGGGSAFFLHVSNGRPTAGCVSVSRDVMVQFMQRIAPGAYIINVNNQSEIANY